MLLRPQGHIPRPPNAFMIFRSETAKTIGHGNQINLSKYASLLWNEISEEEKEKYRRMAEEAKIAHGERYPDYRYRPGAAAEARAMAKAHGRRGRKAKSEVLGTSTFSSGPPSPQSTPLSQPPPPASGVAHWLYYQPQGMGYQNHAWMYSPTPLPTSQMLASLRLQPPTPFHCHPQPIFAYSPRSWMYEPSPLTSYSHGFVPQPEQLSPQPVDVRSQLPWTSSPASSASELSPHTVSTPLPLFDNQARPEALLQDISLQPHSAELQPWMEHLTYPLSPATLGSPEPEVQISVQDLDLGDMNCLKYVDPIIWTDVETAAVAEILAKAREEEIRHIQGK